jgi:hypothetical protein
MYACIEEELLPMLIVSFQKKGPSKTEEELPLPT